MLKLTVLERSFQTKSYQKEEERQKINELGNKKLEKLQQIQHKDTEDKFKNKNRC